MTAAGVAPQIITDCRHVTTGFKHFGLCASKFLNEMQSYFSCEKRTLDHWTTVQFIPCKMLLMSLFQEGFVLGICWRNLCTVAPDALTPASVHSLWSSPKFLKHLYSTILPMLRSSLFLLHLLQPWFSLPANFQFIFFNLALCEQPVLSAVTFCG